MGSLLKVFLAELFLNFTYFSNLNIENKTLKYFRNLKTEAILFIHDKFILKDNNTKTMPNIKSKKFIVK